MADMILAVARRVSPASPAPWGSGSMRMGPPNATITGVRRGLETSRCSRDQRSCVPQMPTGTIGTPVARATRTIPDRPLRRPDAPRSATRPSGKMPARPPLESTRVSSSSAARSRTPRRTGICLKSRNPGPRTGCEKKSAAVRKRRARPRLADALDEALIVDYAVDARWNLVRFRALDDRGNEAVAVPGEDGLQVAVRRSDGSERTWAFEGATAVWSPSPCSLLLVDRLLGRREG